MRKREQILADILNGIHFELRKGEDARYFLYDTEREDYYPYRDDFDTELRMIFGTDKFDVKADEDGVYHIEFYGEESDLRGFKVDSENFREELADFTERMTERYAMNVLDTLDTFICDSYLGYVNEIFHVPVSIEDFDLALEFEAEFREKASQGDREAQTRLDCFEEEFFEEMRFINLCDADLVDLPTAYAFQVQRQREQREQQREDNAQREETTGTIKDSVDKFVAASKNAEHNLPDGRD